MPRLISVAEICDFKGSSLKKACAYLILLFLFTGNVFGQDPGNIVPSYDWLKKVDVINQTLTSLDTDEIPISIDVAPDNFLYVLTFGNGIQKRNSEGAIVKSNFITGLRSPLDFVIDSNGFFYVADYSEDGSCSENGKIRIFNPDGTFKKIIYTEFYRPLGIDVDSEGNLYVAEYNPPGNGCEGDELSRVSIYNQSGARIAQNKNVERPYRIAVSAEKDVYLSQEGGDDPAVLTLNSSLNITGRLPNIQSPGSINIDSFGFIHVIEYAGRIDFSRFINFENLSFGEIQDIAEEIDDGIDDNSYFIRIYDPFENYEKPITENIQFPVDIAFNSCDRMYVDNAYADGRSTFFGYIPEEFEFDIEIYERTPQFDSENPIAKCKFPVPAPAITLENGVATVPDNYIDNGSTDNCGIESYELSQSTFTAPGSYLVTMTVKDFAGNTDSCEAWITVLGEAESSLTCVESYTLELDELGNGFIASEELVQDIQGDVDFLIDGRNEFNCDDLGERTIRLRYQDQSNLDDFCDIPLSIVDNYNPEVTNCPSDISETISFGSSGKIITYNIPTFKDNCGIEEVVQTEGFASGEEFPFGTTTVSYKALDSSNNSVTCSFTVTITEEPEDTPPDFDNCPTNITSNNDAGECGAVVTFNTPTVTDDGGAITPVRTDNTGLNSGDLFPVGETTISFQADDGVNDPVTCSFTVRVIDAEVPEITCPDNKEENFDPNTGYEVPDFTTEVIVSDNCTSRDDLIITQSPQEGDIISESQVVTITVEDSAGLKDSCTFQLTLVEEQQYVFECIGELTVRLGEDAQNSNVTEIETSEFITSDISNLDLELSVQQFTCEDIGTNPLVIRATNKETGESYSCTVNVTVEDVGEPLIICPAGVQIREIPSGGVFILPEVVGPNGIVDNCVPYEDLVIVQDPPVGTEFTEAGDYLITLNATDIYGNEATCEVTYRLVDNSDNEPPVISCPENISVANDNGVCGALVEFEDPTASDDSGNVTVERTDNTGLSSGRVFTVGTTTISYRAIDEAGNEDTCSFDIIVSDEQAPVIECKSSYTLMFESGTTGILEAEDLLLSFRDNCDGEDISLELDKAKFIDADDGETIDVTVTAKDSKDNEISCVVPVEIMVIAENELVLNCIDDFIINADENCNYRVPDFSEILDYNPVNAEISQSIEAGTVIQSETDIRVTATLNAESISCDISLIFDDDIAPAITCPDDQVVQAEPGSQIPVPDFTDLVEAEDNCGIVQISQSPTSDSVISEDTMITITAFDAAGNSSECSFNLRFVSGEELSISCPPNKTEEYNEDCSFLLPDYTGEAEVINGDGLEVIQDPAPGTEITSSEFEVRLSVSDGNTLESCSFNVNLEDNTAPVLLLNDISVNLDADATAIISFEDVDNGSYDACDPDVTYTLSKIVFSCKEIGENRVQVTAEDTNGNIASGTVNVTVTDSNDVCEDPPLDGTEYVYIYPNPNVGSFKISTPADVSIERIEVFDHRGRFIAAKDYDSGELEYAMDVGPLQEAVYVLKIITNEKTLTRRMIFKY
ncbi:HYR domain-containing protein [Christiangramia sp. SM2212]|uniref:HYR domain-containing protein n=1 Tax=Christiangramia sediminicola TaxID=3073267 RepID=A0ABU1EN26_9FLAO|nr:HYR domain-containing protein [Christiangramia sp. SM2212]MDR5589790.1 HYR domain-containing protein [Christiangramia sp. SM2212]